MLHRIKHILRPISHAVWPPTRFASFDQLFPEAEKLHYVPPVSVPLPEASSLPPFWKDYGGLRTTAFPLRADYSALLPDVVYCPRNEVVMNQEGVILRETKSGGKGIWSRYSRSYLRRERGHVSGYVSLFRSTASAYFHVVMDWMPRLLSLWESPYDELDEIKLLTSTRLTALQQYLLERLAPPNTTVVQLTEDRLYDVDTLIFTPFKSRNGYLPERYVGPLREKMLPARPSRRGKRILISRQHAPRRRISNYAALEEALAPFGFVSVCPERLSMEEEIELFYDAEFVVGAHGSGLTNILFSDKTTVLELFATPHMVPHFFLMCKSLGHPYDFVLGREASIFPEEYEVDVEVVVGKVRNLLDMAPSPSRTVQSFSSWQST